MDIDQRNELRAYSGLPLLDSAAESKRLTAVAEQAAFEQEWQRRRQEFADQWVANPGDGWLSRMTRYAHARRQARQQVRHGMETASREGQ